MIAAGSGALSSVAALSGSMATVKIMFAALGAYGHLYPMMPLALASAAAGEWTLVLAWRRVCSGFRLPRAVRPLIDLTVHHGGTGTVLAALEAGLPQLLLPQRADQFFNAQILTEAGVSGPAERRAAARRGLPKPYRRYSATPRNVRLPPG